MSLILIDDAADGDPREERVPDGVDALVGEAAHLDVRADLDRLGREAPPYVELELLDDVRRHA